MNGRLQIAAGVGRAAAVEHAELLTEHQRVIQDGRAVSAHDEVNLGPQRFQQSLARPYAGEYSCQNVTTVPGVSPAVYIVANTLSRVLTRIVPVDGTTEWSEKFRTGRMVIF